MQISRRLGVRCLAQRHICMLPNAKRLPFPQSYSSLEVFVFFFASALIGGSNQRKAPFTLRRALITNQAYNQKPYVHVKIEQYMPSVSPYDVYFTLSAFENIFLPNINGLRGSNCIQLGIFVSFGSWRSFLQSLVNTMTQIPI